MLSIQLPNGQFLETGNTPIQVELISPLFNEPDKLLGSYSYPFSFPWTENNKRNLLQAQSITAANRLRRVQVIISLYGNIWKQAELQFSSTEEEADANLLIDNGRVSELLTTRKLSDLTWGEGLAPAFATLESYRAHLLATVNAAPGVYPYVFFPIRNENWLGEKKFPDTPGIYADHIIANPVYLNNWEIDPLHGGRFIVETGNKEFAQTPAFYLTYILKKVCESLSFTLDGDFSEDPAIQRLVIYSATQCEYSLFYSLGYYLPEITFAEFFKQLRDDFSLMVNFNHQTRICTIHSFSNLLDQRKPLDLRKAQLAGYKDDVATSNGLTITRKADETDALYKKDSGFIEDPAIILGNGKDKRELRISTTRMYIGSSGVGLFRIPHVSQIGRGSLAGYEHSAPHAAPVTLRMLYWHGLVEDQAGDQYPYASADNLDYQLQPISTFSFVPNAFSTTDVRVSRWFRFFASSRKLEIDLLLSLAEFMEIDGSRPIILEDDRQSSIFCLLDRISAKLDGKDKIVAKADLYVRLPEDDLEVQVAPPSENVPPPPMYEFTPVYVKVSLRNSVDFDDLYKNRHETGTRIDVWAEFYEDAAGTIPKSVTSLKVNFKIETVWQSFSNWEYQYTNVICNGTETALKLNAIHTFNKDYLTADGESVTRTDTYYNVFSVIENLPDFYDVIH